MKKAILIILVIATLLSLCSFSALATDETNKIVLSKKGATLNGEAIAEYDYTWHANPQTAHDEVKNSPAEYYTGTAPQDEAVYIAHDIIYYPELDEEKFKKVNYDGDTEWVYMYEAEGYENYIFSTLPNLSNSLPTEMMHSAEEAYKNPVLHITKPGTYEISGEWQGQILVDLGEEEDVYANPEMKVTLILNGVNISCTVAPALIFASVYECDNTWEDAEKYSQTVDTSEAGARIVLAEGSENNLSGTNVFRILKTKYKDENSTDTYPAQKKSWKIDGAVYSYQSLEIEGSGSMNITAGYEGLDSEHHLTINSGKINIFSQDDGINVNEDDVSVVTVNGGSLHICAGLGAEGDGIDSNGFLVINGGTVISSANPGADSGLDSDCGSFVNGGTVVSLGSTMDWAKAEEGASSQPILNMQFSASQASDEAIIITDTSGKAVFAYDPDKDEVTAENARTYRGAIISSPNLKMGENYNIYIGGNVSGKEIMGVYLADSISSFEGAIKQGFSGENTGFGQNQFDTNRPEMPENGQRPGNQMPNWGEMPEGFERPEDFEMPENMDGMKPPQNGEAPENIGNFNIEIFGQMGSQKSNCNGETAFKLTEQVNSFSGVADYSHSLSKVEAVLSEYGKRGNIEHYKCSVCGALFADEKGERELTEAEIYSSSLDFTILIIAVTVVGVLLVAVIVLLIVFLSKRKKQEEAK